MKSFTINSMHLTDDWSHERAWEIITKWIKKICELSLDGYPIQHENYLTIQSMEKFISFLYATHNCPTNLSKLNSFQHLLLASKTHKSTFLQQQALWQISVSCENVKHSDQRSVYIPTKLKTFDASHTAVNYGEVEKKDTSFYFCSSFLIIRRHLERCDDF